MRYFQVIALLLVLQPSFFTLSQSKIEPKSAYDCTRVEIAEVDPNKLTEDEQIALLEESLFSSIDKYSSCMEQVQSQMAASGGGGSNGSGSGGGSTSSGSGTGEAASESNTDSQQATQPSDAEASNTNATVDNTLKTGDSGAKNQVIAPKDNDSIVCGMLYEEISKETDESVKAGLVKQYKSYDCG